MHEAPSTTSSTTGLLNRATWLSTILSALISIVLSIGAISGAQYEISSGRIHLPVTGTMDLSATFERNGRDIYGYVRPSRRESESIALTKPEVPWLKAATVAFIFAIIANINLLYLIIRRKSSARDESKVVNVLTIIAATLFFAGANPQRDTSDLAIFLMAYACVCHLAHTRWERLRAQLYRD
jgi:hypothetical protein